MATEIVADLANSYLRYNTPDFLHSLDDKAELIVRKEPSTLQPALGVLTRDPYLRWANANPAAYVNIFVDNFQGLSQGPAHWWRRVR